MEELIVSGLAFLGPDLEPRHARIGVQNGRIISIEETVQKEGERWICPGLFNAHTHLGDAVAMDLPSQGTIEELVTPPHGLKHRILEATPYEALVRAMRSLLGPMLASGTHGFCDFREGGAGGVAALREALLESPLHAVILGRNGGETTGDGLGIAGTRDVPDQTSLVQEVQQQGKMVGIHAGERDPYDVDDALSLDPDFLVHCTHATDAQLKKCADQEIPIVVCPRSNWQLGVTDSSRFPPLRKMRELGCTVFLGTDNAMFVPPELFGEMSYLAYVYKLPPAEILYMATGGSAFFGSPSFIEIGAEAHLIVLDPAKAGAQTSRDPAGSLIKRLGSHALERNVIRARHP
ncbi:MAG: amidohydrolase family protein [Methanomicrobiales archaeon]|nr:amidohydrolase family protein [Methanomicrobiales archaeon]